MASIGATVGSIGSLEVIASLESIDATLTQILVAIPGPGSFAVTANATATAAAKFGWLVINL